MKHLFVDLCRTETLWTQSTLSGSFQEVLCCQRFLLPSETGLLCWFVLVISGSHVSLRLFDRAARTHPDPTRTRGSRPTLTCSLLSVCCFYDHCFSRWFYPFEPLKICLETVLTRLEPSVLVPGANDL